ncbi:hypothetical protein [Micromonospora sp. NBRC 101691]|uniref:hypothetical protein n=1 Tax=Micromonospora sp. NBRC 101691 TaxID=3032198 RepID=UPI0024A4FBAE|nr:hypothetical protein [Micromonospora sp. NBRC 101691]GLY23757.1 hypothetical protein Misp04_34890 [Micromonospora sp. NBRC 101691]
MASIDFSYPNDRAIEHIGILDKFNNGEIEGFPQEHPDGWIQAVIDKIQADIMSNSNNHGINNIDWSDYTAEEKAAYDWYKAEVVEIESWNALVADFRENDVPDEDSVDFDEFDESDHLDIDGSIDPPEVSVYTGGSDNSAGDLLVSTAAIRYFANSIGELFDDPNGRGGSLMLRVGDELASLEVKPGKFAVAEIMRRKIHGTGEGVGLVGDTQGLLEKIHQTLYTLRLSLLEMADSYELTEDGNVRSGKDFEESTAEFNAMTEEELGDALSDPWGHINGIDDFGQISSSGEGGDGDGGDGSGDGDGAGDGDN